MDSQAMQGFPACLAALMAGTWCPGAQEFCLENDVEGVDAVVNTSRAPSVFTWISNGNAYVWIPPRKNQQGTKKWSLRRWISFSIGWLSGFVLVFSVPPNNQLIVEACCCGRRHGRGHAAAYDAKEQGKHHSTKLVSTVKAWVKKKSVIHQLCNTLYNSSYVGGRRELNLWM